MRSLRLATPGVLLAAVFGLGVNPSPSPLPAADPPPVIDKAAAFVKQH